MKKEQKHYTAAEEKHAPSSDGILLSRCWFSELLAETNAGL
jgi:hypothetical protein